MRGGRTTTGEGVLREEGSKGGVLCLLEGAEDVGLLLDFGEAAF